MQTHDAGRILKSSSVTLEILDAVVELDGARVAEIADQIGISESTASNHLHTLRRTGFLTTEGDIFQPSLKLAKLGEHAKNKDPAYQHAIEITNELDEKTNFETSFTVEENGVGRYLRPEVDVTTDFDKYFTVGGRIYLHSTAAGKAILAHYSDDQITSILDRWGLPELTDQTITSRERFMEELDEVRERGYALNHGEDQEGVYAIGQAATKPSGAVLGAISIAGPTYRTQKQEFEERLTALLADHIDELEARLR